MDTNDEDMCRGGGFIRSSGEVEGEEGLKKDHPSLVESSTW